MNHSMDETGPALNKKLEKIKDIEISQKRDLKGPLGTAIAAVGLLMSLFHVIVLIFRPIDPWFFRSIHVIFGGILVFSLVPGWKRSPRENLHMVDYLLIGSLILPVLYLFIEFETWIFRVGVTPNLLDAVFSLIFIIGILEMARRTTGLPLTIIALLFILYGYFGQYMPGILQHKGYSWPRMLTYLFSLDGILSIPVFASAHYIFLFILFGAFLETSGAGRFFVDFARSIAGGRRGGPAKVSIVSSAMIGTASGSSVANVVVDGVFNIPLMKASGFKPTIAGAIEAMNSAGGQIVPPVMGAGAFLMAEILGIPYPKVALAAIIPALLYYSAAYWMIDLYSARMGLLGMPKKELPVFNRLLKEKGYLLIPLLVLLYCLMFVQLSPFRSAMWATIILIGLSWIRHETRLGLKKVIRTLSYGPRSAMEIVATCAAAGIIVGVISQTGLGMKFAMIIMSYSKGHLFIALILSMVIAIVLGMGMPTTAAYAISASVLPSALIKMGVHPIGAHLFIFYFACLSPLTPPLAVASYAAAAIANARVWDVAWLSMKFAIAGFIVPYMFVYGPPLILEGNPSDILFALITGLLGTMTLSAAIQGWFWGDLSYPKRGYLLGMSLLLIKPGWQSDLIGLALFLPFLVIQLKLKTPLGGERK
jgi:TRAP transporter 4TM/12TM fusion protein